MNYIQKYLSKTKSNAGKTYVLMLSQQNNDKVAHLIKWCLEDQKITELKFQEIVDLTLINVCKIQKNLYFISGGYNIKTFDVNQKSYLLDTINDELQILPECPQKIYDFFMIQRNNILLALGGRTDPNHHQQILSTFWTYDISSYEWVQYPDIPEKVSGIKQIFLDNEENLIVVLFGGKVYKFDFEKYAWEKIKEIKYDFRRVYVCKDKAFLYNEIDRVLYSYDYYKGDKPITDHFYIEEQNKIYFLNNQTQDYFMIYDPETNTYVEKNDQDYKKYFGNNQVFRSFVNPKLLKQEVDFQQFYDMTQYGFIQGNEIYPFQIWINKINGNVQFKDIDENLLLRSFQGAERVNENVMILAGGKYHSQPQKTTQLYDLQKQKAWNFVPLEQPSQDCYFLMKYYSEKPSVFILDDRSIQHYNTKELKWVQLPQLRDNIYIPNELRQTQGLITFYMVFQDQKWYIVFQEYDKQGNKWNDKFRQEICLNISLNFCVPVGINQYLIIVTENQTEYFYQMSINKTEGGDWESIEFLRICQLHDSNIKNSLVKYIFLNESQVLFIFTDLKNKLIFKLFDGTELDIIENEFMKNFRIQFDQEIKKRRLDLVLSRFVDFSISN